MMDLAITLISWLMGGVVVGLAVLLVSFIVKKIRGVDTPLIFQFLILCVLILIEPVISQYGIDRTTSVKSRICCKLGL